MIPPAIRFISAQLCLGLLALSSAMAANSAWLTRAWQTDDGLPNNQVTAIAQGQDGYLWVGTKVGLARFDGFRFTGFAYGSSTNNGSEGVKLIVPNREGGLWILTRGGQLFTLSPDLAKVTAMTNGLPSARPWGVLEDKQGALWIALSTVSESFICRIKDGQVTQYTLKDGVPDGVGYSFTTDSEGNVWMAKGHSVAFFRDGHFETVPNIIGRGALATARTNGIWIAIGGQLYKANHHGDLQDCGAFPPIATTIMEDDKGAVWIGTFDNGLLRFSESGMEQIETSHAYVSSLAEDREGNIWAGTTGGGLDRISTRTVHLEGWDTGSSLMSIQSVCENTNGELWGVTLNGTLVSRTNEDWGAVKINPDMSVPFNCVAADHKGTVWIGSRKNRLDCWRDGKFTSWDTNQGFASRSVVAFVCASNGDLWIGEQISTVVQCLHDGKLRTLNWPDASERERITAMAQDAKGDIWVAVEHVLLRVEDNQLVDRSSLMASAGSPIILCIYPTTDGALWLGLEGGGLGRLKNGRLDRLETKDGLVDNYISQIVEDNHGWLWFGSERGIFKAHRAELEDAMENHIATVRCIRYAQNEGLFSMEANSPNISPFVSPNALRSSDGRIWMPMRAALAVANPTASREMPAPPSVLLTQITLDGKIIAKYGGITSNQSIANLKSLHAPLQLPPGHRKLDFEFTALNFRAPENIHFRYRLEGLNSDWADAESRSATFSRLDAGDYRFHVEEANGDGVWSEAGAPLEIKVSPFLWQNWWFRVGTLALFTTLVIAIVRYLSFRRLRAQLQELEQRAALDKERTRIARDLHDDLGCSLTHVALVLEMNEQAMSSHGNRNGNGNGNRNVQLCSPMVRQVVKSVDEIIWAISPSNDKLQYLFDYIVEFAVEFLHAAGISPQMELPDRIVERSVSPEARHNLFLVVKEALNNIVRHAQASEVRFQVTNHQDELCIVIEDNGKGFENAPSKATSDGLRNMHQRMEEIGGEFQVHSTPGSGTRVTFIYRWARGS